MGSRPVFAGIGIKEEETAFYAARRLYFQQYSRGNATGPCIKMEPFKKNPHALRIFPKQIKNPPGGRFREGKKS
ncbi:hypothetical protein DCCM_3155 [Desulfocucumis palustris]|uniref:Uncharacterized protein n=1 Tax=Desulfocucumis palustris TaxID=1898651 RepID=A0A2L2XDE0_9FIRM|nr:hypothetical protein DCCM_3155 [Desulfocucumis palustris]